MNALKFLFYALVLPVVGLLLLITIQNFFKKPPVKDQYLLELIQEQPVFAKVHITLEASGLNRHGEPYEKQYDFYAPESPIAEGTLYSFGSNAEVEKDSIRDVFYLALGEYLCDTHPTKWDSEVFAFIVEHEFNCALDDQYTDIAFTPLPQRLSVADLEQYQFTDTFFALPKNQQIENLQILAARTY